MLVDNLTRSVINSGFFFEAFHEQIQSAILGYKSTSIGLNPINFILQEFNIIGLMKFLSVRLPVYQPLEGKMKYMDLLFAAQNIILH